MKTRSLASRNLCGGFLGGFVGILTFSLVHLLLPIGCLVGMVIGYWYQEIWEEIKCDSRKVCNSCRRLYIEAIVVPKEKLKSYLEYLRLSMGADFDLIGYSCFKAVSFFIGTIRFMRKIWSFLTRMSHRSLKKPMIGLNLATTASLVCFLGLWLRITFPFSYTRMLEDNGVDDESWVLYMLGCVVISILPVMMAIVFAFVGMDEAKKISRLKRDWLRYKRFGLLGHLAYKFLKILQIFMVTLLVEILGLTYIVIGVISVIGFMALPIALAKIALRVLWHYANMTSHWLCFVVTLTVTVISALITQKHLHGTGLWMIATLTGSVAGLLSELVRRLIDLVLSLKPSVVEFANKGFGDDLVDDFLEPLWKNNFSWIQRYFFGWIPMLADF